MDTWDSIFEEGSKYPCAWDGYEAIKDRVDKLISREGNTKEAKDRGANIIMKLAMLQAISYG